MLLWTQECTYSFTFVFRLFYFYYLLWLLGLVLKLEHGISQFLSNSLVFNWDCGVITTYHHYGISLLFFVTTKKTGSIWYKKVKKNIVKTDSWDCVNQTNHVRSNSKSWSYCWNRSLPGDRLFEQKSVLQKWLSKIRLSCMSDLYMGKCFMQYFTVFIFQKKEFFVLPKYHFSFVF